MNTQNGNAIIWIFIAVGLFAALGYAFTQSTRTSTNVITDAQAQSYAQEIIAFGNEVKQAAKRLQLRGVEDTEFSFGNNVYELGVGGLIQPPGHNANCTTNKCEIFSVDGGGITPKIINEAATTGNFQSLGHSHFKYITIASVGTNEPELVMQVQHISAKVCARINRLLNINNSNSDYIPPSDSFDQAEFNGTYNIQADLIGDTATLFSGKKEFCSESNNPGQYRYNQVLIAR